MRLEYLFPFIDDKRKLETLHNATLRPSIERGGKYFKIGVKNGELGLTTSDFYYLYNHREVVHTDYFNQYVTTLQNETNIFSLGFDGLWNEKFLDLIADYIFYKTMLCRYWDFSWKTMYSFMKRMTCLI